MRIKQSQSIKRILCIFSLLLCCVIVALAKPGKTPKAVSIKVPILSGIVQIVRNAPTEHNKFSYAILQVDSTGRCVTNTLPLRFDLDTTQIANGPHKLQVVLYGNGGVLATLPATPVLVQNPREGSPTPVTTVKTPQLSPTGIVVWPGAIVPSVLLDGAPINFAMAPFIIEGRTMALLRTLIESADGTLHWQGKMMTAVVGTHRVTFTENESRVDMDGQEVMLARPVMRIHDRIYAPASLWRDLFAGTIEYEASTHSVKMYSLPKSTAPSATEAK